MSFLNKVIKELDNEFASIVDEGIASGDCSSFVDTGSYILNALCSGSIFGGLPQNKITALAGESSTGKTFFALSIVKNFWIKIQMVRLHTLSLSLPSLRT